MKIISPENFGVFAICVVVIEGLRIVIEQGITGAIIHKKEINPAQINHLMGINIKVSFLIWSLAILVIYFFSRQLFLELGFLFTSLLFYSFTVVPRAVWKKEYKFGLIAKIEICSLFIALAVAVILIFFEHHFWALICWFAVNFLFLMIFYLSFFRNRLNKDTTAVDTYFMEYSRSLGINNLMVYAAKNYDQFLVTGLFGFRFQGIFNRSLTLFSVPSRGLARSISEVLMTSLSQKNVKEREILYYRTLQIFSFFLLPMIFIIYFLLDYLILMVGSDWSEIHYFSTFVLVAIIPMSLNTFFGSLLVSSGKKEIVYKGMYLRLISTFFCLSVGAYFGITGLLIGKILSEVFIFLINSTLTKQILEVSFLRQMNYFKTPFIAGVVLSILILLKLENAIALIIIPIITCLVYFIFDRAMFQSIYKITLVVFGIKR